MRGVLGAIAARLGVDMIEHQSPPQAEGAVSFGLAS